MKLQIEKISPQIKASNTKDLEKTGCGLTWLVPSRKCLLRLDGSSAALASIDSRRHLLFPEGSHGREYEVDQNTDYVQLAMRFGCDVILTECYFQNCRGATVRLKAELALASTFPPQRHPFIPPGNQPLTEKTFEEWLTQCLEKAWGTLLSEAFSKIPYIPGVPASQILRRTLFDAFEFKEGFSQKRIGLVLESLHCSEVSCDPVDDDYKKQQEENQRISEQIAQSNRDMLVEETKNLKERKRQQHHHALENERKDHETQLALRETELKKLKIELENEQAELARKKAERRYLEVKTEQERHAAALLDKKIHELQANAESAVALRDTLEAAINKLSEELSLMKKQNLGAVSDSELIASIDWQAWDRLTGTRIYSRLPSKVHLPSSTYLNVSVKVNRAAYVYVLVRNESWQILVPDQVDMMGISRENRQKAGEVVYWPGVNKAHPDKPFWCLDPDNPGTEYFIVVASLERLDIARLLSDNASGLRKKATRPVARYECGQSTSGDGVFEYCHVLQGLAGEGVFFQEFEVKHSLAFWTEMERERLGEIN